MSTISPKLFPSNGLRALTPKEVMQRTKALNCTVDRTSKPSCSGQLNIGIFFDGTGNNLTDDYSSLPPMARKHSNVVKLFHVFPENNRSGFFRFYIPGVGTPFPQIGDVGNSPGQLLGGPFAWNGENRITWAFTRLLNTPHTFVHGTAMLNEEESKRIANNLASAFSPAALRRMALRNWQAHLERKLVGSKPEIELINLSVFGFSRGAAEARAFCNWLFEVCDHRDGGWLFAGIRIRLSFLGIFDTVASVGVPNSLPDSLMEGHQSWADGSMEINPAVEQCVHFVAGHEVRAAFPLDSVRVKNSYPGNAKEVMYPGAHSDLGGGYPPNAVGIAPNVIDSFAIIPGAQMYQEARTAGVPLVSWNILSSLQRAEFTPAIETVKSFNAYVASANISSGPVEELHRKNMSLYLSYRYKYRNNIEFFPFYKRASNKDKKYIIITNNTFNQRLRELTYPIAPSDPKYSLVDAIAMQKKMLLAAGLGGQDDSSVKSQQLYDVASAIDERKLTPEIEEFFGNHMHDSMAGFIDMGGHATNEFLINGLGIMRFRKIFKENG